MIEEKVKNRFWNKVNIKSNNDCWNWLATTAGKSKDKQYGMFWFNNRMILSHRMSYAISNEKEDIINRI